MNKVNIIIFSLPFFLVGIYLINKSIKLRFNGKIEKLEGTVIDIVRERGSRGQIFNHLVVEYFNGYNYITYESSYGTGFSFKRIGDKVTMIKNTETGVVAEQGELYGTLFMGIICMATSLAVIIENFY